MRVMQRMGAVGVLGAGVALCVGLLAGCGDSGDESTVAGNGATGGGSSGGSGGSGATIGIGGSAGAWGGSGGGAASGGGGIGGDCGRTLTAVIRDFTEQHPDFEGTIGGVETGLVQSQIGQDRKPVYALAGPSPMGNNTGPAEFAQWYTDVQGVNQRLSTTITFQDDGSGGYVYDNSEFFPIDGQGFGNGPADAPHNYLFTTEIHTRFTYHGGETFTFRGDDDLWIFVNNNLAIDIGGVHGPTERSISMDDMASQLGISVGNTYVMDIFHAERHTTQSNFRIETTISCFTDVPVT